MSRRNLTDRFCRTISVDAPEDFRDPKVSGLELRVAPSSQRFSQGVKSWRIQYRLPGSRKKLAFKIGRFPDISLAEARSMARALFAEIAKGKDPRHTRQAAAAGRERTVAAVWDDYKRLHGTVHNRPRTLKDKQYAFEAYVKPSIGSWPMAEVDRSKLETLLGDLSEIGRPTQRKVHRYLSSFWRFAFERGDVDDNPFLTLRAPKPSPARERVLDDSEIRAFWDAGTHRVYIPMLRFALATAQRFGNIQRLRWSQINLEQNLWLIPSDEFKGNRPHSVPLSGMAIEVLQSLPRWERGDYVFTTQGGIKPFGNIGHEHAKVLEATGTSNWHRHDLRRTAGTILQREQVTKEVAEAFLGHKMPGVTAIYLRHDYAQEKRQAADLLQHGITKALAT